MLPEFPEFKDWCTSNNGKFSSSTHATGYREYSQGESKMSCKFPKDDIEIQVGNDVKLVTNSNERRWRNGWVENNELRGYNVREELIYAPNR